MKILNLRLPARLFHEIDKLSKKYSLSRSEIARQALLFYLNAAENIGELIYPAAFSLVPAKISFTKVRDVIIARFPPNFALIMSVSSSGGIGCKPDDVIQVKNEVLGKFMARVGLIKVLSTGAHPTLVSVALSAERSPAGEEILKGVESETKLLGLDVDEMVLLDTEESIKTSQTGLGVTVIGIAREKELRIGKSCKGDLVVALGRPCAGNEVLTHEARGETADLLDVMFLLQKKFVHEIVPVGSRGIVAEATALVSWVGREVKFSRRIPLELDLNKSAGPATVLLYTLPKSSFQEVENLFSKPQTIIGIVK
ncbi:ribbon-helix-helix domain-containing protein [Candidatus Hecatella orcuttiae]|uniref:ribbon-helix-helix domain-containing protein n=1 Tax=Candidatus Hecatella orcuttiae TaxID=1935119 RepID=UPI002868260F|nr:ribbon-helix-helix domain-containing protein [Candidatus Hecatella orcuttiae]